jgi:dihydrofolate reductase
MKLILMEFVSLDGVSQGPGGPDEDRSGGFTRGGWFVPFVDAAFMQTVTKWIDTADAFLFGRQTYQNFAGHWPNVTDRGDVVAAKLNGVPKYVVSKSLREANWKPTTILSRNIPAQVAQLKQQPGREIQIHGSARLAHSLLREGLVDEVRLAVAPVVVGQGRKLFPDGGPALGLQPIGLDKTPTGLAVHIYKPAGAPSFGTYGAATSPS